MGMSIFDSSTASQSYSAAAQPLLNQLGGLANQYNQNQQWSQNHAAQMYAQQQQAYNHALARNQQQWMINGQRMTFDEFLNEVAPGDDNPMRTFLILKYKK